MLSTHRGGAHTVLGTPYYISPEMCEGKVYDEKSDIWALGCILYEMAALQKTFEGSNLPALVNKIMKGQFAPIRGNYTPLFKQLVRFRKDLSLTQSKLNWGLTIFLDLCSFTGIFSRGIRSFVLLRPRSCWASCLD